MKRQIKLLQNVASVNEIFSRELRWGLSLQISKVCRIGINSGRNLRIFGNQCGVNKLMHFVRLTYIKLEGQDVQSQTGILT